jgi:putative hemolysin
MWQFAPHLTGMLVLAGISSFFSASEAALFLLTREDRERLAQGTAGQRLAYHLLGAPERLLTSILFFNLVVNIVYFALVSMIGIRLERAGETQAAAVFSMGALLFLILFSEMLPKNVAVLWPFQISGLVSSPLSAAMRVIRPLLPTMQAINRISLRTILPKFEHERYLELRDLERAISISTPDKALAQREERVLQQIISLSELEADELMRPRMVLTVYEPTVTLEELRENPPVNNYLLLSEPDSGELARALDLNTWDNDDSRSLAEQCEAIEYVPWCMAGGLVLDTVRQAKSGVVGVVNELGETIGIVTLEDVMHLLFTDPSAHDPSQTSLMAIEPLSEGGWRMSGLVTLRRMAKQLKLELPTSRSVTVAGMLQDQLQRLPQPGDEVVWGNLRYAVVDVVRLGAVTVDVFPLADESEAVAPPGSDAPEDGP